MTTNNVILEVNDLVVEFTVRKRILTAIRNISLKLHEGEILALVGVRIWQIRLNQDFYRHVGK